MLDRHLEKPHAFHEPENADRGNDRGNGNLKGLPELGVGQPEGLENEENGHDDDQLTDLDAYIETQQTNNEGALRESKIGQNRGEA